MRLLSKKAFRAWIKYGGAPAFPDIDSAKRFMRSQKALEDAMIADADAKTIRTLRKARGAAFPDLN
jgi:hypothetical protein